MPVRVQIENADGVCWEASFSAPAVKNAGGTHEDEADRTAIPRVRTSGARDPDGVPLLGATR